MPGVRLLALLLVPVLILVVAVAQLRGARGPTVPELIEVAGLAGKPELVIGVLGDVPGISLRDPVSGTYAGFDIEIGYLIAADLGFLRDEVRFLTIENEDRTRMLARDGDTFVAVDLVVAGFGITDSRAYLPGVGFSEPYLATEPTLVTRVDHRAVRLLGDLKGRRVCVVDAPSSRWVADLSGAVVTAQESYADCVAGVVDGDFEATVGDAAMLAGFVSLRPGALVAHDIGQAAIALWGINTGGNDALRELVNYFLYRSAHESRDNRWETAFERYFTAEQKYLPSQPIAMNRQPTVKSVNVSD